jgi:hypothetical protein
MFCEAAIYLAYYKDIFYAVTTYSIFFGCSLLSNECSGFLIILMATGAFFLLVTILNYKEKVIYMKYTRTIAYYTGKTRKRLKSESSGTSSGQVSPGEDLDNVKLINKNDPRGELLEERKIFRSVMRDSNNATIYIKDDSYK